MILRDEIRFTVLTHENNCVILTAFSGANKNCSSPCDCYATSDRCVKQNQTGGTSKCQCGNNNPDCLFENNGRQADICVGTGNHTRCQCGIFPICKNKMDTCVNGTCKLVK